jgi:SAM-dependent methyltransferase
VEPSFGSQTHREDAGKQTLELLRDARRYNQWLFDRVRPALGQRVLEIGCGTGTLTGYLVDRELLVTVDVVEDYVRVVRERFQDRPNVHVRLLDLTESLDDLPQFNFDSALSVNVFEHIQEDVKAMHAVHQLLRPGGTLTLLVPSHPWLMGPFDRAIGHYRRYTKRALREKLEAAGFVVENLRRGNPVGAAGWCINTVVLRRRALGGTRLYDRLVPLLATVDRWVEPPIGLSIVAVGRKPG